MENSQDVKIFKAMKKFENKEVKLKMSGIFNEEGNIKKFNYVLNDRMLEMQDNGMPCAGFDLDQVETLYFESGEHYALLTITLLHGLEIEIQTVEYKNTFMRDKIFEKIEKSGLLEEILKKEVRSA